ncbi:GNAT family N-acetyltransferase [Pareuzebyella sediminis]|uniref:GNAT family N-acetyltransferase n=1 Tax=Pareuzebyella sediminis TaxID=2607998 RepID=UPI0011ECAF9F|nr:GNAT family N-acetyltransferase [Pareuzebyella sediminis]
MMQLRPATIKDLDLLKYWDTQKHVIDCDPDEDWNWETELNYNPVWREQFIGEYKGEPIGFLQIIDPYLEETHYWGEVEKHKRAIDIWIGETKNLNRGYGTAMMYLAIRRCFDNPVVSGILIDPLKTNTKAHRFYRRFGFEFIEERKFGGMTCFVYELQRNKAYSTGP